MVTIQTLDRYTREHHLIGSIDFIKIDAEGCELSIIHGARETISRDKPVIVVECDGNFIGEQKQKTFFATMAELGYDGFFFTENGRKPIEAFDLSKHQRQDLPR